MHSTDEVPDEVPVADAVEQQLPAVETDIDDETIADEEREAPLEASPPDWQEQREEVVDDSEERNR
jgi:hypothetical protein